MHEKTNIGTEDFLGVIIEESLAKKDILKRVNIARTKVEKVTEWHDTPWIKQWTLHTVEIPWNKADSVAKELQAALDPEHEWYADFKSSSVHYIIFRGRIFRIDRTSKEQYDEARQYGISLGIPAYQVNFETDVVPKKD